MRKYLDVYAEPGTAGAANIPAGEPWSQVLVVPVCNEETSILRPLPPSPGRSLMILVINERETAPAAVSAMNRAFAGEVAAHYRQTWRAAEGGGLELYSDPRSPQDLLLVDRYSTGRQWGRKGGVGHARKTGADLAAFLFSQGRISSPWIHCSDADVVLPRRYFSCTGALDRDAGRRTAALIYPFRHGRYHAEQDDKVIRATELYEFSLRYYVAGLRFAGSPYAFHTIGSTLAINANHYCAVRGFPRRQAGEDFYLLNKLAKVGSIRQLEAHVDCEPIGIEARLSDRVPFGTGAAVTRIAGMEQPARQFRLYDPRTFSLLRHWLGSFPDFWRRRSADLEEVLDRTESRLLVEPLRQAGASHALSHALRHSADLEQFNRQLHTWFDAFRTLKLVHFMRDHHFPAVPYQDLLQPGRLDHLEGLEPGLEPGPGPGLENPPHLNDLTVPEKFRFG